MGEESRIFARIARALREDTWRSIARPNQLAPEGDWWTVWLLLAGRGFGKSRSAAEWVREQVTSDNAKRIALVGATAADVRDIMVEGPSGLLTISPEWDRPSFEPSKRRITFQNGAVATLFSSEESDRLRGQNSDLAWCDEICSWSNQQDTWDQLMFGLRVGARPRVCVSTTPKPGKLLRNLVSREGKDVTITHGSSYENRANLAPAFFNSVVKKYEGTRLARQELNAELLEDVEGGLWSLDMFERARVSEIPPLKRIVVAVDPAGSVGEDSDETAIVVAGVGFDDTGYVVDAISGRWLPPEWSGRR